MINFRAIAMFKNKNESRSFIKMYDKSSWVRDRSHCNGIEDFGRFIAPRFWDPMQRGTN